MENFSACHLLVVAMLDYAKALVKEIGEWNQFIAAFAGQLNDALSGGPGKLVSEIAKFPNFEHLEAVGADAQRQGN